jgi:hypothetical protein
MILRQKMKEMGISYQDLADMLARTGVNESRATLYTKLKRGTFAFAFFLRCIEAMQSEQTKSPYLVQFMVDPQQTQASRRADLPTVRRPRGRPKKPLADKQSSDAVTNSPRKSRMKSVDV